MDCRTKDRVQRALGDRPSSSAGTSSLISTTVGIPFASGPAQSADIGGSQLLSKSDYAAKWRPVHIPRSAFFIPCPQP
jgi:hypothetical protein